MGKNNKVESTVEITQAGISHLDHKTDMEIMNDKIDILTVKLDKLIDSIKIFKLNFQQTTMNRR